MAHKVLFVSRFSTGGAGVCLETLVMALRRTRFRPVVLFYRDNPLRAKLQQNGIRTIAVGGERNVKTLPSPASRMVAPLKRYRTVRAIKNMIRGDIPLARDIVEVIRTEQPALVVHNDNLRAHRASVLAAWWEDVPQICHVRSFTSYLGFADRLLASLVDHFIFVSSSIGRQCGNDLAVSDSRGSVLWDPVESVDGSSTQGKASELKDEFKIADGDRVVVNVGRLVEWKGQDVFIEAMHSVKNQLGSVKALIVGGSSSSDAGFERELERLIASLGLDDQVFLTGHRTDVPAIMRLADVVVHSSTEPEPYGRVVAEAMMLGRPVVATAPGGPEDVISDGHSGLLVRRRDPDAMADAIMSILANPTQAERMGEVARRFAEEELTVDRHLEEVCAIFERYAAKVG